MKYLIRWNACGYGDDREVVEADTQEEADQMAYEKWREEAENEADYSAKVLTPELAEEWGMEDEL